MQLVTRYADWVIKHPKFIWGIILAISFLALLPSLWPRPGAAHIPLQDLEITKASTSDEMFRPDRADSFLVIQSSDLFAPSSIQALRSLVSSIEKLPYIQSVFWIEDIPPLNIFGLSPAWLPDDTAELYEYDEAKERILKHPLVYGQLISPDATTLLLPVRYDWMGIQQDEDCTVNLLAACQSAVDAFPAEFEIGITGRVPLYLAAQKAFRDNHRKFQIISYILVFFIATALFRDVGTIMIVGAVPAISMFWTSGALDWLSIQGNDLTSVVLPVLITMVGLTDGVHLMVVFRKHWTSGQNRFEALHKAIGAVGVACLLTSITTAVGFGSLLLARSTPIRDFGIACSVGVLVTFVAVLTIIPALAISHLGKLVGHEKSNHRPFELTKLDQLLNFILRRYRSISILGALLTILCIGVSLSLKPDARTINALPADSPATGALKHCNESMGGIDFVKVTGEFTNSGTTQTDVYFLEVINEINDFISRESLLRHPLSIQTLLDSLERKPSTNSMDYVELLSPGIRNVLLSQSRDQIQIYIRTQDLGAAIYTPIFARLNEKLQNLEDTYSGLELKLSGIPVKSSRDVSLIVYDLVASLGTASIIILIVMIIFYRSWRIGLVTIIPNLFPLALTGALLVATDQNLAIVSVCALAVCIGIAVDDSIHFLTRFRQELEKGLDVESAIRSTFFGVGGALVITTLILISGFATVLISPLPTHRMFSMMACATIGGALVGDLLFLPALLKWLIRQPSDILRIPTLQGEDRNRYPD